MGNKGSITVDDKHIGESRRFIPVNNEIIDRYLNKFKKRGAKLEKWESKLSKFLVKHKVASYREPYRNEADLKEIYIAENPPPIEEYTIESEYTRITLNLSKKETEGLINTLSEMLSEEIIEEVKECIKAVIKALKKAMKSKSKIKFHLYKGQL